MTKDLCATMHWDFLDSLPVWVTSISYSSYFKNFYFSCKRKIWISGLEILLSTERQTGEWSLIIWDALSNIRLGLGEAWLRPREPDYLLPMWESPTTSNPTNLGWVALCPRPCSDLWSLVVWIFVKIRSVFQNQSNRNRRHKREEKAIWWATHWLPPYYFLAAPPTLFPLIMNSNRWS